MRCYEADGSPAEVEIESLFPILGARRANLVEEPGEPLALTAAAEAGPSSVALRVEAGELATIRLRLGRVARTAAPVVADDAWDTEAAQPVFSRYWLHNKGPAPMGNQAVAVHVLPTACVLRAGEAWEFTAQVASGSTRVTQSGQVELLGPDHWDLEPSGQLFSLSAGAFMRVPVRLRVPESCRPGRYFVAARVVDATGQAQEDVVTVDVVPALAEAGREDSHFACDPRGLLAKPDPFSHPAGQALVELEATLEALELALAPLAEASLGLVFANRTLGELRGELQLVSPIETWPYLSPRTQAFSLRPGERRRIEVSVRGPGQGWLASWALFKVTYFGRIWYSPTVALRLGAEPLASDQAPMSGAARSTWQI